MSRPAFRPIAPRWPGCLALGVWLLAALPAAAQSLSCSGSLVEVGDDLPALLRKCGKPVRVAPVCVPRPTVQGWLLDSNARPARPVVSVDCAPAEDWTYDRGPGAFRAIVRLREAVVESIRDAEKPPG